MGLAVEVNTERFGNPQYLSGERARKSIYFYFLISASKTRLLPLSNRFGVLIREFIKTFTLSSFRVNF